MKIYDFQWECFFFTLLRYNETISTLIAFKNILTFDFKAMHFFLNYHAKSMIYCHQISKGKYVCVNMNNAAYVEYNSGFSKFCFFFLKHHMIHD